MSKQAAPKKAPVKEVRYSIIMEVEISGTVDAEPLIEDSGSHCYVQWAVDDIEDKLGGVCKHLRTKRVLLEEVGDD